jgi:hypothetical protein
LELLLLLGFCELNYILTLFFDDQQTMDVTGRHPFFVVWKTTVEADDVGATRIQCASILLVAVEPDDLLANMARGINPAMKMVIRRLIRAVFAAAVEAAVRVGFQRRFKLTHSYLV